MWTLQNNCAPSFLCQEITLKTYITTKVKHNSWYLWQKWTKSLVHQQLYEPEGGVPVYDPKALAWGSWGGGLQKAHKLLMDE